MINKVVFDNLSDFELVHIFECGQCFRWRREDDGSYTGVIKQGVLNVNKVDGKVIVCGNFDDLETVCTEYFDLNRNYSDIKTLISFNDEKMKEAIKYGSGIRILNQDTWEMLISFIISAANNIPRISKTIENLSRACGKEVEFKGKKYYLFPTAKELSKLSMDELRACNLGFRDKYIFEVSRLVASGGLNLDEIKSMKMDDAKKELMKLPGVGAKVADCILLFSMGKMGAFPVDTWIKKIMNEVYIDSKNVKKINQYATQRFGEYAGIAQQYLFYFKRES